MEEKCLNTIQSKIIKPMPVLALNVESSINFMNVMTKKEKEQNYCPNVDFDTLGTNRGFRKGRIVFDTITREHINRKTMGGRTHLSKEIKSHVERITATS